MDLGTIFSDYSVLTILTLSVLAFFAGFIDAVVGGGGLIQLPALLVSFPREAIATIFGTNKIAALSGTSVAAYRYSRRINYDYKLLISVSVFAFGASFLGAKAVSTINPAVLKPVILLVLIAISLYTFFKKDLGSIERSPLPYHQQIIFGSLIGLVVGFYDGFFGPGTGSFFVLGFVTILGFEFVKASAYSKFVNCMTNISALIVFVGQGSYIIGIAVLMSVCNISGNVLGSGMALKKGNTFVRRIFQIVVGLMILRYGYEVIIDILK